MKDAKRKRRTKETQKPTYRRVQRNPKIKMTARKQTKSGGCGASDPSEGIALSSTNSS